MPEQFPLDAKELTATLRVRGCEVRHVFQPITASDWIEYEKLSAVVSWRDDAGLILTDSMEPQAAADLWQRRILRVDPPGELADLSETPLKHQIAAIAGLSQVFATGDDLVTGGLVKITLEAARNGQRYAGLEHFFRRPSMQQSLAYERLSAQCHAIRYDDGVRKSLVLSRLPELIELYDALIEDVCGYQFGDLGGARVIADQMDPMHKKQAALALFGAGLGG
ncbi:MAG: hypothetical protein GC160_02950 [Acidobacteria bacterium]|nr:hypothetical protein [Acidobacteriota bacterium]